MGDLTFYLVMIIHIAIAIYTCLLFNLYCNYSYSVGKEFPMNSTYETIASCMHTCPSFINVLF